MCRSQRRKGAIPASAGERRHPDPWRRSGWGYPRKRGGTMAFRFKNPFSWGLSPQARGNAMPQRAFRAHRGAIPASAGEREQPVKPRLWWRGYPRKRGGTLGVLLRHLVDKGLSPQARGNVHAGETEGAGGGAIPASAGERLLRRASVGGFGGYPRKRGGTNSPKRSDNSARGLSPQARGNVSDRVGLRPEGGAIPASAGERCPPRRKRRCGGGYPRKRGGTVKPVPKLTSA